MTSIDCDQITMTLAYLHSDPDAAIDCVWRLRQDGKMRGAATAPHSAATTMEQSELDAVLLSEA